MKIFFCMLHPGYVRNYESVIQRLAERNHSVCLAFDLAGPPEERKLGERLAATYPNISICRMPKRGFPFRPVVKAIRGMMDYLRYFDPRYDNAPLLRKRAALKIRLIGSGSLVNMFQSWLRTDPARRRLNKLLFFLEECVPTAPAIDRLLEHENPDVVLVTPLVNYASEQVDVVRSAHALGKPVAICVASWDNLTNKGLLRVRAEHTFVWNDAQKTEAVEMHGVDPDSVVVTGAQCFDKWFTQSPSVSLQDFCLKVGLPTGPFLLYLASSPFIGGANEPAFVRRWVAEIRNHSNPSLASINIVIRPHPQNTDPWENVDFSEFENVVVFPKGGANPITQATRNDFFDSLSYAVAAVGINTSAQIEAGIAGAPVFTITPDEFSATQGGTLHFHHLVNYGLLHPSNSLAEHVAQLSDLVDQPETYRAKNRNFLESFIRPHGLAMEATPLFVDRIEGMPLKNPIPRLRQQPVLMRLTIGGLLLAVAVPLYVLKYLRKTLQAGTEKTAT